MALWKAGGESWKKEVNFRWWYCGRQGGLNALEGFLSVDHSPGMVPWWFPPTQPKGLNPLEVFLSVDHFPCNVCLWWGSRSDASVPMGKRKTDSPSTPKSDLFVGSESMFCVGSEFLVLGVSRCWKWVDFWCWKWVVNRRRAPECGF